MGQYHEGYPLFADIYNLQEYTNYTVQIQAITILDGVLAPPFTTLTGEDRKYGAIRKLGSLSQLSFSCEGRSSNVIMSNVC